MKPDLAHLRALARERKALLSKGNLQPSEYIRLNDIHLEMLDVVPKILTAIDFVERGDAERMESLLNWFATGRGWDDREEIIPMLRRLKFALEKLEGA